MNAFGIIVNSFSPVHAYSAILPAKEFVLPNWTWQSALDNISAFFHMALLIFISDVPNFVPERRFVQG